MRAAANARPYQVVETATSQGRTGIAAGRLRWNRTIRASPDRGIMPLKSDVAISPGTWNQNCRGTAVPAAVKLDLFG